MGQACLANEPIDQLMRVPMDVSKTTLHEIPSVGAQYRVYPRNSPYPHISIGVDDITTTAANYSFETFHYSATAAGPRIIFSVNALNQWACGSDGVYVPPPLKAHVQAAKAMAQAFLAACGHDDSWAW